MLDIKLPGFGKEKTVVQPKEEGPYTIMIKGKMKKDCTQLLKSLGIFNTVKKEKEYVMAMIVESTDRKKNPYSYISFKVGDDGIQVEYTVTENVPNPDKRKLDVCKSVFTIVSYLESKKAFIPDPAERFLLPIRCIDMCDGFLDADSLRIKHDYDRVSRENDIARKELEELKKEKESLGNFVMELEKKNNSLEQRITELEGMTDRELDREIVKWVEEHHGELDDRKFCSVFGLGPSRLEERLDAMAKGGIIRIL